MRYLDEVQKTKLNYLDAIGRANTEREKARAIADLLPQRAREIEKMGALEKAQLEGKLIAERQARQTSGPGVGPQDEGFRSMAPAEVAPTGMSGLGPGGGGIGSLEEVFGGGGPQPADKGGQTSSSTTPASGRSGYQTITDTQSRAGAPFPWSPMRVVGKTTRTQRDPQMFQTNVHSLASEARLGTPESFQAAKQSMLDAGYSPQYILEVEDMAKKTARAEQLSRFEQVGAVAREFSTTYGVDAPTGTALARAELAQDHDEVVRLLGGKKPQSVLTEQAKRRALDAQTRREEEQILLIREGIIDKRIDRQTAFRLLNAKSLSTKYLGYSLSDNPRGLSAGGAGTPIDKQNFVKNLDELVDASGAVKPESVPQARLSQHLAMDQGGLLFFNTAPKERLAKMAVGAAQWFGATEGSYDLLTFEQAKTLVQNGDVESLERLKAGRSMSREAAIKALRAGSFKGMNDDRVREILYGESEKVFVWSHEEDPLHIGAEPARALQSLIREKNRIGEEIASLIQTDRGITQTIQESQTLKGEALLASGKGATNIEAPPPSPSELPPQDITKGIKQRDKESREALRALVEAVPKAIKERDERNKARLRRAFRPWPGSTQSKP